MAVTVEMVKETGRLEGPAIRAYDKLLTGWMVDGKVMYPSDYGGAYLSDDYKLVVNFAGEGIQTKLGVARTFGRI